MNHDYLMLHLSRHLHTLVRRYLPDGSFINAVCARVHFRDLLTHEEAYALFPPGTAFPDTPLLASAAGRAVYARIPCPDCGLLIGPVRFSQPVFLRHHHEQPPAGKEWLETVPLCEFGAFVSDVLLACNLYRTQICTENTLILTNCVHPDLEHSLHQSFSRQIFENRETGKTHNPYDQELREFTSIETGDPEQLRRSLDEDYIGEIGTLAKDPLRQAKNLAIVNLTLASRAAIRGGLTAEISYSLSDSYIQKVEECHDAAAVLHLMVSAKFEYAYMVRDLKRQKEGSPGGARNPHIEKCKDYIFAHLHDKIEVQEIASALSLNANYLSGLFRQYENISLTAFIRREKIRLAKNLLTYSAYSHSEIAAYLGFSSQSHLGRYFKADTGMTLRRYRDIYGVRNPDIKREST